MDYDVIIVGAGSMGMAAGYYLARDGKRVLLLDAHDPPHTEGSHHGEKGVFAICRSRPRLLELTNKINRMWTVLQNAVCRK